MTHNTQSRRLDGGRKALTRDMVRAGFVALLGTIAMCRSAKVLWGPDA